MRIQELEAARGRAIIEIEAKDAVTDSGLHIVRENAGKNYQPEEDFEIGVVLSLGAGDWEPLEVGDRVIVRAISGGKAGADIGHIFGRGPNEVIVIALDEAVCKLEG